MEKPPSHYPKLSSNNFQPDIDWCYWNCDLWEEKHLGICQIFVEGDVEYLCKGGNCVPSVKIKYKLLRDFKLRNVSEQELRTDDAWE